MLSLRRNRQPRRLYCAHGVVGVVLRGDTTKIVTGIEPSSFLLHLSNSVMDLDSAN